MEAMSDERRATSDEEGDEGVKKIPDKVRDALRESRALLRVLRQDNPSLPRVTIDRIRQVERLVDAVLIETTGRMAADAERLIGTSIELGAVCDVYLNQRGEYQYRDVVDNVVFWDSVLGPHRYDYLLIQAQGMAKAAGGRG